MEFVIIGLLVAVVIVILVSNMSLSHSVKELRARLNESEQRIVGGRSDITVGLTEQLKAQDERLARQMAALSEQLRVENERTERALNTMRETVDGKLLTIQKSNEQKLNEMRETVDEKLSQTLEKRLDSSFKQVSERLEQVYKGLGEMQNLATGVGDLKRMLTNVKTRGTWGEIQLGALLEQMLTPSQYAQNVAVIPGSADRVEFAIILPGKDENDGSVYIPIDSKFPVEDYQRLLTAQDAADPDAVAAASKELVKAIKTQAKKIHDKYIAPPHTTDFAIMFLPVEGLFAEVVRNDGLIEELQRELRITVTGPTTLSAFLSSLQMGFRTLAIEKRSSEVWNLLGAIKTEFGKFAGVLEKTQDKLRQASNEIEHAGVRTRAIERKLRGVSEVENSADMLFGESGEDIE